MAKITLHGTPVETVGELPAVGRKAPDFTLTKSDLSDVSLRDFAGKVKILSIVPSLDTGVCAKSTKEFNAKAGSIPGLVVLVVSADLPFAQSRFCEAAGTDRVVTLSRMRGQGFGRDYGVEMRTGPLAGILSRAVLVVDKDDRVVHAQQVPEIAQEPDYAAALEAASEALGKVPL